MIAPLSNEVLYPIQDQFGRWRPYQMQHGELSAYKTASSRAKSTGKRHRIVDEEGGYWI